MNKKKLFIKDPLRKPLKLPRKNSKSYQILMILKNNPGQSGAEIKANIRKKFHGSDISSSIYKMKSIGLIEQKTGVFYLTEDCLSMLREEEMV